MSVLFIGETVEWRFPDNVSAAYKLSAAGVGVANAVAYESGEDTWQDFVVLVEMSDGRLVNIPSTVANMRVIRKPTS